MPALSPAAFNIGVACTDAHLHTPRANQTAMIVVDERGDVQRATYAELAASSSRFAQTLAALDIAAGARIMIRLPNSLDYPTAFLGALKASAIAVPISPQLTGDELAYLAIVESGYRVDAKSPAGAAGAWQFMPYTGMKYGLNQDWWMDERLDPYKATEAAADYLAKS